MKRLMILGVFTLVAVMLLPGCSPGDPQISGSFYVIVDYDLSREEMVKAGRYDRVNDNIFHHEFIEGDPADHKGQEEVQLELVCFNERLSTETVLKKLSEMGYRPATFAELCAFGAKYPDKQEEFTIMALGSVFEYSGGNHSVAYLGRVIYLRRDRDLGRFLDLRRINNDSFDHCRFLAVRK